MSDSSNTQAALKHLETFVGRWNTEGTTSDGRTVAIRATDTYEWMAGGFFLIHHVDARLGDDEYKSIEIIGYDAESDTYPMQYFDSWGRKGSYQATIHDNTWKFIGDTERATVEVSEDGQTMSAHWEMLANGSDWQPWMDVKLTKVR